MADPYHEVESGLAYAGIDQGIDFTGAGPVRAGFGTAKITRIVNGGSGWPGRGAVLDYQILDGPFKDKYVYVAEDFVADPSLRLGAIVKRGGVIGQATGEGAAPGIEMGFATADGRPLASRPPARPADQHTAVGQYFHDAVLAFGGTGGGDSGGSGILPVSIPKVGKAGGDAINTATKTVSKAFGSLSSVGDLIGWISNTDNLLRIAMFTGGGILLLGGVYVALGAPGKP